MHRHEGGQFPGRKWTNTGVEVVVADVDVIVRVIR
jgi:hypothetical protein